LAKHLLSLISATVLQKPEDTGISDDQICWSHVWLAHTALKIVILPGYSTGVPKSQTSNTFFSL